MNKKNNEQLLIKKLYIKDISFENFLSSKNFRANSEPVVDINVKLTTTNIADDDHELILYIKAETKSENQLLFILELQYAGVFKLKILDEKRKKDFIIEGGQILIDLDFRYTNDVKERQHEDEHYEDDIQHRCKIWTLVLACRLSCSKSSSHRRSSL